MSLYQWSLSFDALSLSPLGPVTAGWDETEPLAGIGLFAEFNDFSGTFWQLSVLNTVFAHHFGGGPTRELVSTSRVARDWSVNDWSLGVGTGPASAFNLIAPNGNNGSEFLAATQLLVTLDDVGSTISFTGCLGTATFSFAALGIAAGPLQRAVLARVAFLLTPVAGSVIHHFGLDFFNFYLSKDGVRIAGAELGAVQPGFFSNAPWLLSNLGAAGGTASVSNGRTDSRLLGSLDWDPGVNLAGIFEARLDWDTTHTPQLGDVDAVIALLCEEQSGTLVYARVRKQMIEAVEVGISFDSGHTWTIDNVGAAAGRVYATPSLAESPDGSINLFIWDRSTPHTTRWFHSATQGATWDDFGILLSVLPWATSSSPRAYTLETGFFIVSYNQTGHWFLAVYDGGTAASLPIQSTDMGANPGGFDTFPALYQDAVGNVYAARAPSVLQEQIFRSEDLGVDWTTVLDTPLGSKQIMTAWSLFSPFIWKLWQDVTGGINVAGAENFGSVYLFGAVVAFAGAAQQYCGITVLPKGFPIFVFQTYHALTDTWSVDGFHSEDLGLTWIAN